MSGTLFLIEATHFKVSKTDRVNSLSAGPIYIWDPNFVITVPADGLAPNGARPSAGTVMTVTLYMSSSSFHWLSMPLCNFIGPDTVIQNGHRDVT